MDDNFRVWTSFSMLICAKERQKTFVDWPLTFIVPRELAENGFFYTKKLDSVQCYFCRGSIHMWEEGDIVRNEHRKHFAFCPLVRGMRVGNISLDRENDETEGYDIA